MTPTMHSDSPKTREPILFFHLPKTAGSALRQLFAMHLGEDRVTKSLAMPLDQALVRYEDADAICGHFFAEHGHSLPADRISLTVLRSPVDRFLSYYYFQKFDVQQGLIDQRVHALDLDEFVAQLTDSDLDELNKQTFLLYPLGTSSMKILPWPERVLAAQRALDRFDYVGVHDEIEDFVCMLSARMGWPSEATLDRVNVTSRRHAPELISAETRKKLDQLLQYDQAVYEHAVARFRQLRRASILGSTARFIEQRDATDPVAGAGQGSRAAGASEPREFGDRRAELLEILAVGEFSGHGLALIGEQVNVHVNFIAHDSIDDLTVGFLIRDERGMPVFGTHTHLLGETYRVAPGRYRVVFSFLNRAEAGAYVIDAKLIKKGSHFEGCHHWKEGVARFDVIGWGTVYFDGRVMMDASAHASRISPEGNITACTATRNQVGLAFSTGRLNPRLRDYSARITLLCELPTLQTGTELLVDMEVENTGTGTWPSSGKQPVCVSYHWHDANGNVVEQDGLRTRLPRDISAGERIRLVGLLRAPSQTGALRLVWTLVQEGVAWFDQVNPDAQCRRDVLVS